MRNLLIAISVVFAGHVSASQVGTLTGMQGNVKIFTHPGTTVRGPAPHAKFKGKMYSVRTARIGDKLGKGNIIRTAPGSKVRIVYDNGDQFNVGPATAYTVSWNSGGQAPKVNLMYGNIRAVISKKGPRNRLKIRTKSATMGVRGTDFSVSDKGHLGGTEVAVLRGKVEVASKPKTSAKKTQKVTVAKGQTAKVAKKIEKKTQPAAKAKAGDRLPSETRQEKMAREAEENKPAITVVKTNKAELIKIHKESTIKKEIREEAKAAVADKKVVAKIEKLEKKAKTMVVTEIKKEDPKLYAKLQKKKDITADDVNGGVVQEVFKSAPKGPNKPYADALDDLEDDAYKKYFKVE